MQYRIMLGALAITMMPVIGTMDTVRAGETGKDAFLANKFDGKGFKAIGESMPPQEKPDELARLKVEESYGKLPMSFIRNDGQIDDQVRYYEKGAGHATYFTKKGVYLSLAGGRTSAPLVSEQLTVDGGQTNAACRVDQNVSFQAASLNRHGSVVGEIGYGPRITENGIQSNPEALELFLISCSNPTSQISNPQTFSKTWTNKFVHATPTGNVKSETCGGQGRTI